MQQFMYKKFTTILRQENLFLPFSRSLFIQGIRSDAS